LSNFGGPGDVGVDEVVATAEQGIGYSTPVANCSASSSSLTAPLTRRFVDKLYGPRFSLKFFTDDYQSQKTLGEKCQAAIGGTDNIGPYMHSAVVAQDMISFLDAYANSSYSTGAPNPTHLNYWGFSYGTYIGQVFANMYPSRVGRVVLDAVVDSATNRGGGPLGITYSDEALSTFFVYCNLAGPSLCSFATGTSSNDVLARFEAIVNKLTPTIATLKGWSK
jgi:pimeloyl-ACP methyl ester carboxylesterase